MAACSQYESLVPPALVFRAALRQLQELCGLQQQASDSHGTAQWSEGLSSARDRRGNDRVKRGTLRVGQTSLAGAAGSSIIP
ncbi:MAG: hypothetical protein ACPIOQ_20205 [Promethearchaeia archaeon]